MGVGCVREWYTPAYGILTETRVAELEMEDYSEQIERALRPFCEKIQDPEHMAIKCQALERNLLRIEVSRGERST